MSEPFVAEIRIFAGNFAPTGWATCDGQLLPISQNTALFSLLGTFYGGNGTSNFALPNLEGSAAMGSGSGAGLTPRFIGESSGQAQVTLLDSQMPLHNHSLLTSSTAANTGAPAGAALAPTSSSGGPAVYGGTTNPVQMAEAAVLPSGGGLPHDNLQPYLGLTFIIALQGVYPPRS